MGITIYRKFPDQTGAAPLLVVEQPDQVQIGATTDLLSGLESSWNPTTGNVNLVRYPTRVALSTTTVRPFSVLGEWGDLHVSLHETPEDLLTAVIPFSVNNPVTEGRPPDFKTGGLLIGSKDSSAAADALGETLGVPLSSDYGYAFARVSRCDGERVHSSLQSGILKAQVTMGDTAGVADHEFEDDLRALPRVKHLPLLAQQMAALSASDATKYLDFFKKWGTHFISRVELGDQIMQVFAYRRANFEEVKNYLRSSSMGMTLSGSQAQAFAQFTSDVSKGRFGFVSHYGTLMSLSGDRAFLESLSKSEWVENLWSEGEDSIFQAYAATTSVPYYRFGQMFTSQALLSTEVSPLTMYCEQQRAEIWRRLLKAAACATFLDSVDANFEHLDNRSFDKVLPDDQPGVLSALPTPNISVYKARLDLSSIQLVSANTVENFFSMAYVTSVKNARDTITLPGDKVQIFAGIIDARSTKNANVIKVTDAAFDSMDIGCGDFLGTMRVENTVGTKYAVLSDGLRYEFNNGILAITGDVRTGSSVPIDHLPPQLENFRFAMTFADAVLGAQQTLQNDGSEPPIYVIIRDYLSWVAKVIPKDTSDEDLMEIRVRALILGSYKADSNIGAFVPILPPNEYELHIRKMMDYAKIVVKSIGEVKREIDQRKSEELVIDVSKTLNENIIQTGNLLAGFVQASAEQQADIASSFDNVIEQQKREAVTQQANIDKLSVDLHSAQSHYDLASQRFQSALEKFKVIRAIKAAVDIGAAVFSLGTSVVVPSSEISGLKSLGSAAQKIQKTFNVLDALKNVYDKSNAGVAPVQAAQKLLDNLDGGGFGNTSSLPWDEMQLQFDNVMAQVPIDPSLNKPKADVILAFKIMGLRAKSLTGARTQLHQIQSTIYENQKQRMLTQTQQERLDALTSQFNTKNVEDLDTSSIDLVGMTAMLNYRRDQVLASLSRAFLIQDQTLQYETLQLPTLISSYSLLNFMQARSEQAGKAVTARSELAGCQTTTTAPITFRVSNVPITAVTDGKGRNFSISPNSPQFADYVYVRVKAVVLSVNGVDATDTGKFAVRLRFQDDPFVDRDLKGNATTFHTPQRERIYEYKLDGTPIFSDKGETWSDIFSDVTPFGGWYIDFPKLKANAGLQFKGTKVSFELSFVLETRIVSDASLLALATSSKSLPSATETISTLHSAGTVTNEWDVVFSMDLSSINAALKEQYDDLKSDPDFNNKIIAETSTVVSESTTYVIAFTDTKYDTPTMVSVGQLVPQMRMQISQGSLTQTSKIGDGTPATTSADVAKLVLDITMNPEIIEDSDPIVYEFNLGNGTYNWLDIKETDGKYNVNGAIVTADNMSILFEQVKAFFAKENVKFHVKGMSLFLGNIQDMNADLAEQYNDVILKLDVKNSIIASGTKTTPATKSITKLELVYSYPLMFFDTESPDEAKITLKLLSGTSQKYFQVGDDPENPSGSPISLKDAGMEAYVELKKVKGTAANNDNELRVVLDIAEGEFTISNLRLTPVENLSLAEQIKAHFRENSTPYLINKLNLSETSVSDALLPNGFVIKLLVTPKGAQVLQLFIQTGSRALKHYTQAFLNNFAEPLPRGYHSSILIRSELFMGTIMPDSISKWTAEAKKIGSSKTTRAWKVSFTKAEVSAKVDLSSLNTASETYWLDNDRINWDLGSKGPDALTLTPQSDGSLKLAGTKSQSVKVNKRTRVVSCGFIDCIIREHTSHFHVSVQSDVIGTMKMSVDAGGRDQKVGAAMSDHGLTVEGRTSGGGPCGCDDLEAQLNTKLKETVPSKIKAELDLNIEPVSTFAIKNLLFYKTNYINLKKVAAPGDLVMFGNFTT